MNPNAPFDDDILADAVAGVLDADTLPIAKSTIEKRYLPLYDLADLKTPKIAVAPRLQVRDLINRQKSKREHVVQVAVHLIGSNTDEGDVDDSNVGAFVRFVGSVNDQIERAGGAAGATWMRSETQLYDPEELKRGVLRAVLTITYKRLAQPPPTTAAA